MNTHDLVSLYDADIQYINRNFINTNLKFKSNIENYNVYKNKLIMLGYVIKKLPTMTELSFTPTYIKIAEVAVSDNEAIVISDKQLELSVSASHSCAQLFSECEFNSVDLSNVCTQYTGDTICMFRDSKINKIKFDNFDTSSITEMNYMFWNTRTDILDLRNFNMLKVKEADGMFEGCRAKCIDLTGVKIPRNIQMYEMFKNCKADLKSDNMRFIQQYEEDGALGRIIR